jgi:hypothetical protein
VPENYSAFAAGVASGTDKTVINLFDPAATPTRRASIYDIVVGSVATPADQACKFSAGRTTAVGTEGAGFTPNNLDPGGPAGELDSGNAHSAEPTYTANKQLLVFSLNQRATFRWVAAPGSELRCAATQNNGIGIKSASSTSTQSHEMTILFAE